MPFAIREYTKSNFQKAEFLRFDPGLHIVRFLETADDALLTTSHFVVTKTGQFSVVCLGDDCPLCLMNRKIFLEHPKDFNKQPGYFGKSDRYTINVLDRTPAKVCPKCNAENFAVNDIYPTVCNSCKTLIATVEANPLNKIKLLQLSRTSAVQINDVEKSAKVPITSFDIAFSVSVPGGKKVVTPIPIKENNDVIKLDKKDFLDKSQGIFRLTASEIVDALKGISLRDIFAARKAETPTVASVSEGETTPPAITEDVESDIQRRIKELYGE